MRYLLYGLVRMIEASLFYFLASLVLGLLDTRIPPMGSPAFIIFVVIWPFIGPIVHPGLHRIPIIGDAFCTINDIALSALGRKRQSTEEESKNETEA